MCIAGHHHPQSMYCGVELSEGVQISVNTCCHPAPDTSLPGKMVTVTFLEVNCTKCIVFSRPLVWGSLPSARHVSHG